MEDKYTYENGKEMKSNKSNHFDEYFTKDEICSYILEKSKIIISKYENINDFFWIEPSVGNKNFYNLLPKDKRIGIDINSQDSEILKIDYLKYEFERKEKSIVIGNPPFGHRGVKALKFLNHSNKSDFVIFILPMYFGGISKDSMKNRVKNLNLIHSEILPNNSFYLKTGVNKNVKCVFQIWSKDYKTQRNEFNWETWEKYQLNTIIEVKSIRIAKSKQWGLNFIGKCDFYIQSVFFKDAKITKKWDEVKYKSGLGVIFKNINFYNRFYSIFEGLNWNDYSLPGTNSCKNISKTHIYKVIWDNLSKDEQDKFKNKEVIWSIK